MNQVSLIGRLGQDPEIRYTEAGTAVTNMSLAVKDIFKNASGERQEYTNWIRLVSWNKGAEIAQQYLRKGDRVAITGALRYRVFEQDGKLCTVLEVVTKSLQLLQSASASVSSSEN